MLVLAIIAMASVVVVPNLGGLESRTFSAQVREASSLLNYTRRMAVVTGQPATASFHFGSDAAEEVNRSNRNGPALVGRWQSSGLALRYRDSADREIEVEDKIDITFYPEGGSTGGTLNLQQDDRAASIAVDPFTGRVTAEFLEDP
jgi:general secretion pathway protein H